MSFGAHRRQLRDRARTMRQNPTRAERKLWSRLRRRQLKGKKFRRQHILEPYIVDFYCASDKIVVEVDGLSHDCSNSYQRDHQRTNYLQRRYGVDVLRFSDAMVIKKVESVLETIAEAMGD